LWIRYTFTLIVQQYAPTSVASIATKDSRLSGRVGGKFIHKFRLVHHCLRGLDVFKVAC